MIWACPLGKELEESALIGSWQFLSRHLNASWTCEEKMTNINFLLSWKWPDNVFIGHQLRKQLLLFSWSNTHFVYFLIQISVYLNFALCQGNLSLTTIYRGKCWELLNHQNDYVWLNSNNSCQRADLFPLLQTICVSFKWDLQFGMA